MDLEAKLRAFLQEKVGEGFAQNRYLLAVSGGLDSVALLELFVRTVGVAGVAVAHYQHGLRGLEAEGDAIFVQDQATRLGVAFVGGRRAPGGDADEASLRRDRRVFLEKARQAQKQGHLHRRGKRCHPRTGAELFEAGAPATHS